MTVFDWLGLLTQWSRKLIEAEDFADGMPPPPEVLTSGWLGYPGASVEQIAQAEERLGTSLPPSYREFLQVTNGWRHLNSFIYRLWSTEEVEWFAVRNQEWIDIGLKIDAEPDPPGWIPEQAILDEEYLVYDDQAYVSRWEYLQTALEISDTGDAVLLLNPQVITTEGEWEAWFFASWSEGRRYRSFWEMMQDEYQNFLDLIEN